jgi:lysozyme
VKTNKAGIDLIKQFEGIKDGDPSTPGLDPYICPTGYVTIGYGRVLKDTNGAQLKGKAGIARAKEIHSAITMEQADEYLVEDLAKFEADVQRICDGLDLNENQFAAIVSFTFNLGAGALQRSTLLKHLKAGDFAAAAEEFPKWNKGDINGDGKLDVLPGLVRRREAERQLFLREVPETKPLIRSRTLLGSGAAIAATAAAVLPDIIAQVQQADQTIAATGTSFDLLKYVLAGLTIVGAGVAAWARIDDSLKKLK